jgi:hypothetical protein
VRSALISSLLALVFLGGLTAISPTDKAQAGPSCTRASPC